MMDGHTEVVQLLLGNVKLDVNSKDENNLTALHFAAAKDYDVIVRLLLVDPRLNSVNDVTNFGKTPLMTAVVRNSIKSVQELLSHPSVHLDITDDEGRGLEEVAE